MYILICPMQPSRAFFLLGDKSKMGQSGAGDVSDRGLGIRQIEIGCVEGVVASHRLALGLDQS